MVKNVQDNFDSLIKYKLYRNVKDLIHPSISKRNISDYKIIFNDDLLPVRVFYPKKVSHMDKVVIYIPRDGKVTDSYGSYTLISKDLALKLNRCLISIDYFENGIEYPETIDKAWKLGTGAPDGPFEILDIVGLETAKNIVMQYQKVPDLFDPLLKKMMLPYNYDGMLEILNKYIKKGKTGKAAKEGFYKYK